jgi:hypothetical protein
MQHQFEHNMKQMFLQFSSGKLTNPVVGSPSQKDTMVTPTPTPQSEQEPDHDQDQDPFVVALQDKGGYDSDGKSVVNEGYQHSVSHTVVSHTQASPDSKPEPRRMAQVRPSSPTGSHTSQTSESESDNLFLRLKRQREYLLNEIAVTGNFTRDLPVTAQITGVPTDMVGSSITPPNLTLPWSKKVSDHVPLHDQIISGNMARNGTPLSRFSTKNPWRIGELFKEGDLSKSTPFPKAYQPYPPTSSCSHEAVRLEKSPQDQPFEHANAQGLPMGSHIDISKGKVTLSESALVAQENLTMRLLGALNSLDTILNFAATQQEHLSADSMAEVLRHARFDVAASSSYAWRTAHNTRLLRRQAAIDVLQESNTHPPISNSNFKNLYHASLNSESLFGGKLAEIHQQAVQNLQVRPIIVGSSNIPAQGQRKSVLNRAETATDSYFRKPHSEPPRKQRAPKHKTYHPQGPPTKRFAPAGASSSSSVYETAPQGTGKNKGKSHGGRGKGKGGSYGPST